MSVSQDSDVNDTTLQSTDVNLLTITNTVNNINNNNNNSTTNVNISNEINVGMSHSSSSNGGRTIRPGNATNDIRSDPLKPSLRGNCPTSWKGILQEWNNENLGTFERSKKIGWLSTHHSPFGKTC
jgi:hypothetical protein